MIVLAEPMKYEERKPQQLANHFRNELHISIHAIYVEGERLNHHLTHGQFFYVDLIWNASPDEGACLFDSGVLQLEEPQTPSMGYFQKEAHEAFCQSFDTSLGFQQGFVFYYHARNYPLATLCLHQMVEHLFHGFIFPFTTYRHRSHDLEFLEKQAASCYSQIKTYPE